MVHFEPPTHRNGPVPVRLLHPWNGMYYTRVPRESYTGVEGGCFNEWAPFSYHRRMTLNQPASDNNAGDAVYCGTYTNGSAFERWSQYVAFSVGRYGGAWIMLATKWLASVCTCALARKQFQANTIDSGGATSEEEVTKQVGGGVNIAKNNMLLY